MNALPHELLSTAMKHIENKTQLKRNEIDKNFEILAMVILRKIKVPM